jgi:hypothetical protein
MMRVRPDELRLLKGALSASSECASLEQLERLAEPDARLWQHVASCPRCQAEWTLLNSFEAATPRPEERGQVIWITERLSKRLAKGERAKREEGAVPWWRRILAGPHLQPVGFALASVVVVVAVGIGLRENRAPELMASSSPATLRSLEIRTLGPAGDLASRPDELRWRPVDGAASYTVRVLEVDHAEIWSAETKSTAAALPPQVLAIAVPGKPLLWQVTAKDEAGWPVAQSSLQRFRVNPSHR